MQLDRRCGSGLQAVLDAAMRVQTGGRRTGDGRRRGSMSNVEYYTERHALGSNGRRRTSSHDRLDRGRVTAGGRELIRCRAACSRRRRTCAAVRHRREEQDELACRSHQRAVAAQRRGQVRRGDRAGDGPDRKGDGSSTGTSTRAPTRRWSARSAAAHHAPGRPRLHRHGRQRQRAERRCRRVHRDAPARKAERTWAPADGRMVSWAVAGVRRATWASARCRPPDEGARQRRPDARATSTSSN